MKAAIGRDRPDEREFFWVECHGKERRSARGNQADHGQPTEDAADAAQAAWEEEGAGRSPAPFPAYCKSQIIIAIHLRVAATSNFISTFRGYRILMPSDRDAPQSARTGGNVPQRYIRRCGEAGCLAMSAHGSAVCGHCLSTLVRRLIAGCFGKRPWAGFLKPTPGPRRPLGVERPSGLSPKGAVTAVT